MMKKLIMTLNDSISPEERMGFMERTNNNFYKQVLRRIWKKNKNVIIVIVGGTGSGKSYVALKIASKIDPTFTAETLDNRLAYKPEMFFRMIGQDLKKGQAVIIDEGGTTVDAREWQTFNNKAISHIFQTFRYENLCVIITVPSFKFIDVSVRRLLHYCIETMDINIKEGLNIVKIKKVQYNPILDEPYMKNLLGIDDGETVKIREWAFKKPKAKLWHKYEAISQLQKHEIKRQLTLTSERMHKEEERRDRPRPTIDQIVEEVLKNPDPFTKASRPDIVVASVIEAKWDVPTYYAQKAKAAAELKMKEMKQQNETM